MFILDIALIVLILMMVFQQKEVHFDLIIAITMATYTTYKVVITIMQIMKNRKVNEAKERMKTIIHIVDSCVSIINLQYALIVVNGGFVEREDMSILSMISSFVIFVFMMASSIYFFKKEKEQIKIEKNHE